MFIVLLVVSLLSFIVASSSLVVGMLVVYVVVGVIIASLAIVWLAKQTFADQMDTSHFLTMVALLAAMLDPVRKVANVYNMIQRSGAAATRVFEFLDTPDELSQHRAKHLTSDGPRAISAENVTFRYTPEQEPAALDF